jgi:peptidoglycan/LPS O-acetylase OafA/YrhL
MTRDPTIDCIKGIAILMVIAFHSLLAHSLEICGIITIEQGVPLFLITSAYLAFKRFSEDNQVKAISLHKIFKRIFVPFLAFQLIIVIALLLKDDFSIKRFILLGGEGPGSYYPWMYLQFCLLIPVTYILFKKYNSAAIILIIVSFIAELSFSFISRFDEHKTITDAAWRLFVGRYIFITYIAYLIAEGRYDLRKYAPLILLGILFSIISRYEVVNMQPLFYSTRSFTWNGFHWPMYFYSGCLFVILYKWLPFLPTLIKQCLEWMGTNSWEIFLSQMLYFEIFSNSDIPVKNEKFSLPILFILGLSFSIIAAFSYKRITEKIQCINE